MAGSRGSRKQTRHAPPAPEAGLPANGDEVAAVLAPVVARGGAFLEAVTVKRAGAKILVRVTVDLPEDEIGAMTLDAVGEVSRQISAVLDETDVIPTAYTLEVSTPGTSRPLTELRHFKRARTRLVTLVRRDGSTVQGRLVAVVGGAEPVLQLDPQGDVPLADVVRGTVEVDLKRAAELDDDELDDYGVDDDRADGKPEDHEPAPADGADDEQED